MTKSETIAREMRARIFQHMLQTRGWKYKAFLRYLRIFKYASFSPTRGALLESYYTLMRYLDDIADGDISLKDPQMGRPEYIEEKIRFCEDPTNPVDEVDYLMQYCLTLAQKMGQDFREETSDILHSLLFDARRNGKWTFFPQSELKEHFHTLDIRGTIRATLKIFREDPDKYIWLEALGTATRYHYDLQDFEEDIKAGYVNIPEEDCNRFGISRESLHDIRAPGIQKWFRHHAEEGMLLLEKHRQELRKGNFSLLARATFPLVYEGPARNYFRKILHDHP